MRARRGGSAAVGPLALSLSHEGKGNLEPRLEAKRQE